MPHSNRLKMFTVMPYGIAEMLRTGETVHFRVEDGLPADARFCRVISPVPSASGYADLIAFQFESETFPAIEDGGIIPEGQVRLWKMPDMLPALRQADAALEETANCVATDCDRIQVVVADARAAIAAVLSQLPPEPKP